MNPIRISVSSLLGLVITFGLVFVMFKLIDSGNTDLDDGKTIKIPDFLHIERELTENMKKTEVDKPLTDDAFTTKVCLRVDAVATVDVP